MGLLDKLAFWRKDEAFGAFENDELPPLQMPTPLPGVPKTGFESFDQSFEQQFNPSGNAQFPRAEQYPVRPAEPYVRPEEKPSKDHELILSKLDGIKHALDNVLLRLERMEQKKKIW